MMLILDTRVGLKQQLNILHNYCLKWSIMVNLQEKELVVFVSKNIRLAQITIQIFAVKVKDMKRGFENNILGYTKRTIQVL